MTQIDDPVARRLSPPTPNDLRDELEKLVLADLLGPAGGAEEEVAERHVNERYLVGMLAPRGQQVDAEEQDELATDGAAAPEEGPAEVSTPQALTMFPSSFGLSFCVDGAVDVLEITATWGHYTRQESAVLTTPKTGAPLRVWRRQPRGGTRTIPLAEAIAPFAPDPEQPEVVVRGLARRRAGAWIVTLFLVNGQEEPKQSRDSAWIFQPEVRVRAPDGGAVFQRRMPVRLPGTGGDSVAALEAESLTMLYRRHVEFAVGHGVSVQATTTAEDPTCAVEICTRVTPAYEVPQTQAPTPAEIPGLHPAMFDMRALAEANPRDLVATLTPLVAAYETWIADQAARLGNPAEKLGAYRGPGEKALANCREALGRIRAGIKLLGQDPQAAEAFRFLNRAMWQQRVHTLLAAAVRRGETPEPGAVDVPANRSWRPFQLAFILINLPGITDLQHPDRAAGSQATADLLWFPTGGGKTEAYLGLTAYTLAIRRLQGTIAGRSGEAGVAVLMRYTLRLLTLQQFQRAAALICACEMIRREAAAAGDPRWGRTPFRLGLWVGMRTTPNTTEASHEAITQDRGMYVGGMARSGSPAQLTHCPWCGLPIDPGKNIVADVKGYRRTFLYCGDPLGTCPFTARQAPHEGLPLVVVDEEIYRLLPALVIATVDKFAQMPWNGAVQMLFGQVDKYCPRHGFRSPTILDADSHPADGLLPAVKSIPHAALRPPDLIIQDELHLISGPLGTLVGLYESAVDRLASWDVDGQRVRPKVIASTATIRRASDQIHALFLRQVAIFPPQGLDIADNFFARQRPADGTTPGRRYLGLCANGKRLKVALIRVYVALLGAAARLHEQSGGAADPWMTLVGYFNSMNELAGMRRLVDDDVKTRLGKIEARGLARRPLRTVEELTSRKSAGDIPRVLTLLEMPFATGALLPARGRPGPAAKGPPPLDVLLATNMISVGVDVPRLGLMVVAGQPKNTAEYIQATSRVGRNAPGLVCTVYNWARPRDLSHYESFAHYHATFYQHVEPLSVTPFAPRARDRGLAALLVSYLRLLGTEFNPNDGARKLLSANHPQVKAAIAELAERAAAVTGKQKDGDEVRAELQKLADEWAHQAQAGTGGRILGYRAGKDGLTVALLHAPELGQWHRFTCLNSLRDVEPSVGLILNDLGFDQEPVAAGLPAEGAPAL